MTRGDKIIFVILAVLITLVIGIVRIEIGRHRKEKVKKVRVTKVISPVYASAGELPADVPPECRNIIRYIPPPKGFKAVTPWIHAIGNGKVKIAYLRLYARVKGRKRLVFNGRLDGGLWRRFPAWYSGEKLSIPIKRIGGWVVLDLSEHPDKIWHVWGTPLTALPRGTDSVWVKVKIFIQGSSLVQVGFDYWRRTENVDPMKDRIEGGISRWIKEGTGWEIISVP